MAATIFDWLRRIIFGVTRTPPGVSPFPAGTGPAKLLIMRHAEKTGNKRDPNLSDAGAQRAEKLVSYIPKQFGTPEFLFAATSSKRSSRPFETLEPLAKALGLKIDERFDDEEYDELVEYLAKAAYAEKFGVISWRHSDIPSLVAALGAPDGTYPEDWPEDLYDVVIEMTFGNGKGPIARQIKEPF